MKRAFGLVIVIAVTVITAGFTPAEWFLFQSADYDVKFPAKPVSETKMVPSGKGEQQVVLNTYSVPGGSDDDNLIYMTMSTECPDSVINTDRKENLSGFFKGVIKGIEGNVSGKVVSQTEIETDGYPGRELKIDYQEGVAVVKARVFVVKNKVHVLETITLTPKFPNESIDRFMNSFRAHPVQ